MAHATSDETALRRDSRNGPAVSEGTDLIAGRYRLIAEVGSGGMGVVWRAKDELLGRTVAVKALTAGAAAREVQGARRAMREARIAARLHHSNVIGIYDVVEHEGRPFLVMEYLESRSLSETLTAETVLEPREVARIGARVASGLAAAHNAGIVHRDVKPGNVLISQDGVVKLTDFGISRADGDTTVTGSGVLLGTLAYIPPEVGLGQPADARSDVYSLGATLYSAMEGKPPSGTDDNAIALLYRIVHEDITPPVHDGPLAAVVLWMLAREPDQRPTMSQVQRALEELETAPGEVTAAEEEEEAAVPVVPVPATAAPVQAEAASSEAASSEIVSSGSAPSKSGPSKPDSVVAAAAPVGGRPPNRRRLAVVAGLVVAVLVGVGAVVLTQHGGNKSAAADLSGSGSHSTAASTPSASAASSAAAAAKASSSPSAKATSSTPAPSVSTSPPVSTTGQPITAIETYYTTLVPNNLDTAWNWMTTNYQQTIAVNRNYYNNFWSKIQRMTLSGVTAQPNNSVIATLHYYYKDGTVDVERTEFGLVYEQGMWKIASSNVI